MTPGHRIGGESERFGWIYVPPPSPSLSIHITPGLKPTSERLGRLYISPLPIRTLPIHITPGLKSTSDW